VSSGARITLLGLLFHALVTPLTAGALSRQVSESVVLALTIDKARYSLNEQMKICRQTLTGLNASSAIASREL